MWSWVSLGTCIRLNILPQTSTLEAQEGKGERLDCPIRNTAVLDISIFCDWYCSAEIYLALFSFAVQVDYWAEQKDNVLSTDSDIGAITRNLLSCLHRQSLISYQPLRNGEVGFATYHEEWKSVAVNILPEATNWEVTYTIRSNWCFRICSHTWLCCEEQLTIWSKEWKLEQFCSHPAGVVLLFLFFFLLISSSFLGIVEDLYQESRSEPSAASRILLISWDSMSAF